MAKKNHKKKQEAVAVQPVAAEDIKPVVKPPKQTTLLGRGLPYVVLMLGLLALVQGGMAWFLWKNSQQQREALAEAEVKHYLSTIDSYVSDREQEAEALVANPAPLLAAIAGGSPQGLEAQLQKLVPGSVEVRLSATNLDPSAPSTLSFAQQDQVNRAGAGKPLPPEIAFLRDARVVTVARVLKGSTGPEGVLLVSYPLKPLEAALKQYAPGEGHMELGQGFTADKSTVMLSAGEDVEVAGPLKAFPTRNPNWELRYAPALALGQSAIPLALLIGLLIGLVLMAGGLAVMAVKAMQRALVADIERVDGFAEAFMRYGHREKPVLALNHFGSLMAHIELYGAELRAGQKIMPKSAMEQQRDELADISLSDHDADLLGSASFDTASVAPTQKVTPAKPLQAVPAEIFRAYDIRGRAGSVLTAALVRQLGQAIGSEVAAKGEQAVVVARDARNSSPELIKALIDGLQASGRDVIDVGMVPTPVLYFATKTVGVSSGVMLTGSHNPAEDNGLKIVIAGHTLADQEIQALKVRVEKQDFTTGVGGYSQQSVSGDYIERVASDVVLARPFRVVVDGGNGVAGPLAVRVLESLGCSVVPLFCEPDGNFPNHHPDPAKPENLEDLQRAVAANEAQLGLAFDGDGDRLGVVTPQGKVIYTDRLMMLLAKHVLVSCPGADVVFDVKCSRDLVNVITAAGGRPVMNRTGHSFLKAKLAETGAPLAGEMSGHIIFNDRWFGFDDALYAAARVLEILSMENEDADAVFAQLPESVSTPELSVPVAEEFKQPFMYMLGKKAEFKDATVNTLDGIRVDFPDGWGLVRASNTTSSLVMRFEGRDVAAFTRIQGQFRELLLSIEPELNLPF